MNDIVKINNKSNVAWCVWVCVGVCMYAYVCVCVGLCVFEWVDVYGHICGCCMCEKCNMLIISLINVLVSYFLCI